MGQTQGAPGAADRAAAATCCAWVALRICTTKAAHSARKATIATAFSKYCRIAQHAPAQSACIASDHIGLRGADQSESSESTDKQTTTYWALT
jgi:hypothetical protein